MDTDQNGKVSKQAWMEFMEGEFDRLDRDKKGELDPRESFSDPIDLCRITFET
jgi:hypothetical protein